MFERIKAHVTGPQLKALRRAQRINQTDMGQLIGCSRQAVSYWETKPNRIDARWGVPARMLKVLGVAVSPIIRRNTVTGEGATPPALPIKGRTTRTQGDGVLLDAQQAALDRECARINAKVAAKAARHRQPCEARTRKSNGAPCRNKSEPGRRRCKFHGGKSTGPKTAEGKARIAEAQRVRWAAYRAECDRPSNGPPDMHPKVSARSERRT